MKKLLAFSLVLFFYGALQAQNESLTFRVDANNISSLSPNGIHVAGNWQSEANGDADWVPGANQMDDADADGVYELTVQVPAGSYEYKFINGNDWSENPEGVPGECSVNGNRGVDVVVGGVTTDLVCFGSCEECPTTGGGDVNVTFSVDASQLGSIDPAGIHIAGTFNGFSPEPMTDSGGGIYTITKLVPSNATVLYKYTNSSDFSGVENVPGECGLDDGFGGFNRDLDVADADIVLPTVCFSSCSECTTLGESYDLTLLVDASQLATISDTGLHAAGTFNSFSPAQMTDIGGGIYSLTVSVEEGSTVLWKYINGATFGDEVESVPGACGADDGFGGFNRVLTMPSADTTAGPVCFAQCVACEVAPDDYMLTLSVDASDLDAINPEGGIHVAGTFNGFSPTAMNDDGDGVYSFSVIVAEGTQVLYKFLNSTDFSAAETVPEACGQDDGFGGFNRVLTMPSADLSVGLVCFSSCEACPVAPPCENPYPSVDFNSLTGTVLPNGKLLFEWEPIEGQIGCQINIVVGEGPQQATKVVGGANASSFTAPVGQLVPFTTYNFRVRCGCQQNPIIAGAYTDYAAVFYLPPGITEETGTAYSDTPLTQVNSDIQWTNTNLGSNVIGELFSMTADESWVRLAPNPAQDNVNLSYNSLEAGQGLIQVFDAQGKLALERVMVFNKGLNNVNLNLNELENGIYIVEVLKGESRESVRLLMQ
ncbi:T9SS type A sorting domain-containing protein [Cryomorphaceae bacterium 1068]|nr:T9SS type A sorting domain-containing protein [Cryomorphaceae bacterium 1068]